MARMASSQHRGLSVVGGVGGRTWRKMWLVLLAGLSFVGVSDVTGKTWGKELFQANLYYILLNPKMGF